MKAILAILGIAVFAIAISVVLSGNRHLEKYDPNAGDTSSQSDTKKYLKPKESDKWAPPRDGVVTAVMSIQGKGDVTMELYPKAAPKSVAEFERLVKTGYYNGLKYHRVRPGFMAQVGDPETRHMDASELVSLTDQDNGPRQIGTHGSGTTVPFEHNDLQHLRGTVAYALKSPQSATADGQFFINLVDNHFLDADYCVFGRVTQGMDVVDKLKQGDTISRFVIK